jgi:DnaJ-like protein
MREYSVAFERIAEQRLRQAIADGEFDNLPNAGRPIDLEEYFSWPEPVRMAYGLLKSANCAPIEVELFKEIAALESALAAATDAAAADALRRRIGGRRIELAIKIERARTQR